jgi:hypothetical protein
MKKFKRAKKWKEIWHSRIGGISIFCYNLHITPVIYRFNAYLSKYGDIFHRNRENNPKIHIGPQKMNSQSNLGQKQQSRGNCTILLQNIL